MLAIEEIIEKYKDYLQNDDIEGFYNAFFQGEGILAETVGEVTSYFYKVGADPLEYVNKIPCRFLCGTDIESFTVPSHIKEIGDFAFAECKFLKSVTIPDGIEIIGYGAFAKCNKLKSIKLPDSLEKIGDYAFFNCKNLTDINIPKNLKEVGNDTFYGCIEETREKFKDFIS